MRRVRWIDVDAWGGEPLLPLLERAPGVGVRRALDAATASEWAARVLATHDALVSDFGGEQRALGRAFYTHVETGRAREYFSQQAASDALVEQTLPGMQAMVLSLLSRVLGGQVRRRHGFCGPGVHVFPAAEKVARRGGVFHYDIEGLSPVQRRELPRALSFVWMLQPAQTRGGTTLFPRTYRGVDWPMNTRPRTRSTTTRCRAGDALLFSAYRLHHINAFGGDDARVSITAHAVEVDRNVWECWF